jgi:FKBP-type peptidyl-prolyl cis-trans isomerase FklB
MMMRVPGTKPGLVVGLLTMMFITVAPAADMKLESNKQQFSYAIGVQIGDSLRRDGLDVDAAILGQAVGDVLSESPLRLTAEQMQAAFKSFQEQKVKSMQAAAEANLKKGQAFMAKFSKEKGVKVLDNGLHYKVLTKGSGKRPVPEDTVVVHYRGTLVDGAEFDSSYKRGEPATFAVNAVIEGWQEILPLMPVGSKWQVVIPAELGYGPQGTGGQIGPNETLVFDIELLEIK